MKKRIATICIVLLMTTRLLAQAPNKMSYQAVIRNNSNVLVSNSAVGMRISILQTSPTGSAVYTETQTTTTNVNGLLSIEIGGGSVVAGNFSNIDWTKGPYFIKTETDPTGGSNFSIVGTTQLLSVPYAMYANKAGTSTGGGNFQHYIGEKFGGGIIFHLWKDSAGLEHGLVVHKSDIPEVAWSNVSSTLIGISSQSVWDGLSNSQAIVGQSGHTKSVAKLCLDLVSDGQSDWYLPAIQELNLLWNNYSTVGRALMKLPGSQQMQPSYYWSSTEVNSLGAWYFYFFNGSSYNEFGEKTRTWYVRPIRSF